MKLLVILSQLMEAAAKHCKEVGNLAENVCTHNVQLADFDFILLENREDEELDLLKEPIIPTGLIVVSNRAASNVIGMWEDASTFNTSELHPEKEVCQKAELGMINITMNH
jgi:hypothetical protein